MKQFFIIMKCIGFPIITVKRGTNRTENDDLFQYMNMQ